jgi:hypothetical protein
MFRKSYTFFSNHFFVEANFIINYQKKDIKTIDFIENPNNIFYFTEATRENVAKKLKTIPKRFIFYNSRIVSSKKTTRAKKFDKYWKEHPKINIMTKKEDFGISRNDLFSIFEACEVLSREKKNTKAIPFITNNKNLLKSEINDVLKKTIETTRLCSLIPIITLEQAINMGYKN